MKKLLLSLCLMIMSYMSFSQMTESFRIEDSGITPSIITNGDGNVVLIQDDLLRKAVKRHIEINNDGFEGFRIQVYFGSGQRAMGEAQSVKNQFLNKYGSNYNAYIDFDSPFFKVRVGDFRSKAEALYFQNLISPSYPNSWIVQVKVNYPGIIVPDSEDNQN
jgi:hypothetical protein